MMAFLPGSCRRAGGGCHLNASSWHDDGPVAALQPIEGNPLIQRFAQLAAELQVVLPSECAAGRRAAVPLTTRGCGTRALHCALPTWLEKHRGFCCCCSAALQSASLSALAMLTSTPWLWLMRMAPSWDTTESPTSLMALDVSRPCSRSLSQTAFPGWAAAAACLVWPACKRQRNVSVETSPSSRQLPTF